MNTKYLTGSYYHTVDGKNRIRIPSKIKSDMFPEDKSEECGEEKQEGGKFCVYFRAGKGKCISVYTEETVNELLEKIAYIKESDDEMYWAASVYASSFKLVESDPQGRLVIPNDYKEYAEIDKDIVICGNINHVDIWSQKNYSEHLKTQNLDLTSVIKKLGL